MGGLTPGPDDDSLRQASTSSAQTAPPNIEDDPRLRLLLMTVRSALIMMLGALEDYLRVPRTIRPRPERMLVR